MSKKLLIQRLEWYYPTERFNVFLFCGIIFYILVIYPLRETIFLLYGLLIVTYILFQGQKYWQLKLFRLTGKSFDQAKSLNFFRKSKVVNVYLIGLMPVVGFIQIYLLNGIGKSGFMMLFAALANVFGVLEHINYYYRQISIDNLADFRYLKRNRKLKVSQLARNLSDNRI